MTPASTMQMIRGRQADGAPNPIDQHVGRRIRLRRNRLGWSQTVLAEKLGVTFQQLQKYERGANRVSGSRLYDIAQALNISISYFFEDVPDEVMVLSPRTLGGSKSVSVTGIGNVPDQSETNQLLDVYYRISDPNIRGKVYALAKALAGGR